MQPHRIVFAGTPEFACPALRALIRFQPPVAVLTQPDRPSGRGRKMSSSPVKQLAGQHGIKVLQPASLKSDAGVNATAELEPDLLVTAAYGLLLPARVLALPRLGCWNLHASLLPRWRGASPIQQAILAGDERTGITLMQMDSGLDTGDILLANETPINPLDTAADLHDRLAGMAARLLIEGLELLACDRLPEPVAQEPALATRAPLIKKSDALIDWREDAALIARKVRAYNPWPIANGEIRRLNVRILRATAETSTDGREPGRLLPSTPRPDRIRVACGRGVLAIERLQAAGRKPVSAREWLNSHPDWAR